MSIAFRRWLPEGATGSRARLAIALNVASAVAAVGLFVVLAPPSDWGRPELLGALAAIAAVAFFAEVKLKLAAAAYFDATLVLAVLALAIAGPLPALLVWIVPDAISRLLIRQDPIVSPGMVATVSSFALALFAGYGMLALADPPSMAAAAPALFSAGIVMWAVNFTFARLVPAPFYQGFRPGALIRAEFIDLMPMVLAMLAIGTVIAILIPPLGVFALLPLAAVVLLPQLAFGLLVRGRSVAGLARDQATQLYAAAIGDVLALDRRELRLVACTAELLAQLEAEPAAEPRTGPEPVGDWHLDDVPAVVQAALHVKERWDGNGRPAGLRAGLTPLPSRVVAVARAWSDMTAGGTPELPQSEAILGLSARAGTEFDPRVVTAAATVVSEEQAFVRDPGFQPQLHRLPVPRTMRRTRIPAALARLAQPA